MKALLETIVDEFPNGELAARPITGHECGECIDIDRLLGGRTWREVAEHFPKYCHDSFPLLTHDAKKHYLPAFLSLAVRDRGSMSGLSVASAFERGELQKSEFTVGQQVAILAWLEDRCADDPGDPNAEALVAKWRAEIQG